MRTNGYAVDLSPEPLLAAIEDYHGLIVDLDLGMVVPPHSLAEARWTLARKMAEHGLVSGERVLVAIGNSPAFIIAWAAVLLEGGSPVLLHWETPPAELKRVARRFHIRFMISETADDAIERECGCAVATIDAAAWARLTWADFGDAHQPPEGRFLPLAGVPLHPTSGTTGPPKMAVRPASRAIAEATHYQQTIGIDSHDRILALAPMSHAFGHGWHVITPIVTGADVITMRRFQTKKAFQACHEQGVTILPAVGAILESLTFGAGDRMHDPLRRVLSGGAPVTQRTAANFCKMAGAAARPLYGATEAGAIAVVRGGDAPAARGCVGQPFEGVSVELRPAPEDASHAGLGLVHVRSPSVMAGYLIDERLDVAALADGWFNTGDLGWFDESGALHLRGRLAEVINVAGMKVLPSEVEEVIAALPGVREVKVYARKTRLGANQVRAAVVGDGIDVAAIRAACEQHLIYYKRPSPITLLEAMPRSTAGKIAADLLP